MNTFVDRFSSTGAAAEIRRARELTSEDEDLSDAMWGTEGGFGNIVKGVPKFAIPSVPDVRLISLRSKRLMSYLLCIKAHCILENAY